MKHSSLVVLALAIILGLASTSFSQKIGGFEFYEGRGYVTRLSDQPGQKTQLDSVIFAGDSTVVFFTTSPGHDKLDIFANFEECQIMQEFSIKGELRKIEARVTNLDIEAEVRVVDPDSLFYQNDMIVLEVRSVLPKEVFGLVRDDSIFPGRYRMVLLNFPSREGLKDISLYLDGYVIEAVSSLPRLSWRPR